MIDYYDLKLDVTLLGCGFLGGYHLGALCLLHQIWPQKPYNRLCGASCGGLLAALLLAGLKLEIVLDNAMDILRQLRALIKNPARLRDASVGGLLEQKLEQLLPKNAHELCTGRLGLSLTKVWTFENRFVSQFDSRQELIDAIRAGCFIPGWSGSFRAPQYKGEQFIDGAYSDNCPVFPRAGDTQDDKDIRKRTIQVCAFASEIEVSPRDAVLCKARVFGNVYVISWKNLVRMLHAMMPHSIDTYTEYIVTGHQNMKEYLFENDLLKCRECWHERAQLKLAAIDREACVSCLRLFERVDSLSVPKTIFDIMKD